MFEPETNSEDKEEEQFVLYEKPHPATIDSVRFHTVIVTLQLRWKHSSVA